TAIDAELTPLPIGSPLADDEGVGHGLCEVHPYALHLGELFYGLDTHFPAVPALFVSPEGRSVREGSIRVDPDGACLQGPRNPVDPPDVISPDAGCKAISRLIREGNDFLFLPEP